MADESMTPYGYLVDALNFLADETGTEVDNIRFNRSDVPVDWDPNTERWVELDDNG